MQKMLVFLTGLSGGLGSLLAERMAGLAEVEGITGIDVIAPRRPLPPKVRFVEMDVRSSELTAMMAGHDTVIHTAFITKWLAKMPAAVRRDINVNGAHNLAEAAIANRVHRLVHTSSTATYDIPRLVGRSGLTEDSPLGRGNLNYYCNDKSAAERTLTEVLRASDIILTILRPCSFVGPNSSQTLEGFRDTASRLPGRDPRVQVAHEDDVVAAFFRAVCSDLPGAYNVAPDDFIRMSEVLKITGSKWVPIIPVRLLQMFLGIRWRYLGSPTHPCWAGASLGDYTASNAKLKATGWKPRYGSADALRSVMAAASC